MKPHLFWSIMLIVALCGPLALRPAHADAPPPFALVKDINTAPQPTDGIPDGSLFATLGTMVLFSGDTPQTGRELWRTDSTDAGTQLVKDINIGADGGLPYYGTPWVTLNDKLLFDANDGALGTELWASDGTTAGTLLLKDLWPGAESGYPSSLYVAGNRAFFAAQIAALPSPWPARSLDSPYGLWVTDGTPGGTQLLHAFADYPHSFVLMGDVLMFNASAAHNDLELWRSDGTPGGTTLVKDINPVAGSGSDPQGLFARNASQIFFSADDGTHGRELWTSDGTSGGTQLFKDIAPGAPGSDPGPLITLRQSIGFGPSDLYEFVANDGTHGRELWATDGTPDGTSLVKDVYPNGSSADPVFLGFAPRPPKQSFFTAARALYVMDDGTHGRELWVSSGTLTSTVMLADSNPGSASGYPGQIVNVGQTSFFTAFSAAAGVELWKTDGTPQNTAQVADIYPGSTNSFPGSLTAFNGTLYFTADDGTHGRELWTSDGSSASLFKDIWTGPDGGVTKLLGVTLGALYFMGNDGAAGFELWKTDGTPGGTVQVKNIAPDVGGIDLDIRNNAAARGDKLVFALDNALWQSDGTAAGTTIIKSFPATNDVARPNNLTTLGDMVLFRGSDTIGVEELWRSDGTVSGTGILTNTVKPYFGYVHDLAPFNNLVAFSVITDTTIDLPNPLYSFWKSDGTPQGTQLLKTNLRYKYEHAASGSTLFFDASPADKSSDVELWKTDGTPGGTALVKDIVPGDMGSSPQLLTAGKPGEVFFVAKAGNAGYQLWKSDGTAAGTLMVHDVRADAQNNEFSELAYVNGTLYFVANDIIHGWELWKSDGSDPGTTLLADIYPGAGASMSQGLVGLNGMLYFCATGPDGKRMLWRSDGTATGTQAVRTDASAPLNPYSLTVVQGQLLFSAADAAHGRELWRSDGTAAGTTLLQDIVPGTDSSNPQALIAAGQHVFLTADTPGVGRELWATAVSVTPTPTPTPSPGNQRVYLPLMGR